MRKASTALVQGTLLDRIDGSYLFLRKLTESTLRSKLYKVHRNACVKLTPTECPPPLPTSTVDESSESDNESENTLHRTNQPSTSNRPTRNRQCPGWLQDYVLS